MRHLDVFSGIGGFALAASWVWGSDHELVSFCEKDEFCQQVLRKHWPSVPCIPDIHYMRGENYGTIDLLTAGFPCQPYSVAGKQRGAEDDRALWPETLRVIQAAQPRWVLCENVPGIISLALDEVLASLEDSGYETETLIIPACAVNAPHRRNRVWILANASHAGSSCTRGESQSESQEFIIGNSGSKVFSDAKSAECERSWNTWEWRSGFTNDNCNIVSDADRQRLEERERLTGNAEQKRPSFERDRDEFNLDWLATATRLCRKNDGLSGRMDRHRRDRLKSLGNAIVPQVAAVLFEYIKYADTADFRHI